MFINRLWLTTTTLFLILTHHLYAQVVVSEVYANSGSSQRDQGKEWFEVYNIGSTPIDLANAIVRRLDGSKKEESWRIQLPSIPLYLAPQEYAVIAQANDLGVGICLNSPLIIVTDPSFNFKNSGTQTLCFKTSDDIEDCAPFSNSTAFPNGHSRYNKAPTLFANDDLKWWHIEDCQIAPQVAASPGTIGGFCHRGIPQLPHQVACPIQEKPVRSTIGKNQSMSCQCVRSQPSKAIGIGTFFLMFAFVLMRSKLNTKSYHPVDD